MNEYTMSANDSIANESFVNDISRDELFISEFSRYEKFNDGLIVQG